MEIRGELLGQDHPDYATVLNNMAELYQALGESCSRRADAPRVASDHEAGAGHGPPRLRHVPQ